MFSGKQSNRGKSPAGVTPGDAVPIVIEVECPDGTKIRNREDVTIAVRAAP